MHSASDLVMCMGAVMDTLVGICSFIFIYSSSVWNSIPNDVRCAPSLSSSKFCLKTYLFRSA